MARGLAVTFSTICDRALVISQHTIRALTSSMQPSYALGRPQRSGTKARAMALDSATMPYDPHGMVMEGRLIITQSARP